MEYAFIVVKQSESRFRNMQRKNVKGGSGPFDKTDNR
jgi:hypothetical protein